MNLALPAECGGFPLNVFQNEPLQADEPKTLSKFTFHLPTCRISESTKKLMDLAYKTLIEATESTPQWFVCDSSFSFYFTLQ